jgi:hypothetical protein
MTFDADRAFLEALADLVAALAEIPAPSMIIGGVVYRRVEACARWPMLGRS